MSQEADLFIQRQRREALRAELDRLILQRLAEGLSKTQVAERCNVSLHRVVCAKRRAAGDVPRVAELQPSRRKRLSEVLREFQTKGGHGNEKAEE